MDERRKKRRQQHMLNEFIEFIRKNHRFPTDRDIDENFLFSYLSYTKYQLPLYRIKDIKTLEELTGQDLSDISKDNLLPDKRFQEDPNSISGQIRGLIRMNPDISYEEVKEALGKGSHSIRTLLYDQYKKMYGKTRTKKTIGDAVLSYFKKYPGTTIIAAANKTGLTNEQIRYGINYLRRRNINVPYQEIKERYKPNSIATKIRQYALAHPLTSCAECAEALGITKKHANTVLGDLRRKGLIPRKGRNWKNKVV